MFKPISYFKIHLLSGVSRGRPSKGTGLKTEEFARAMGVSVAMVQEWESKREKPTPTELRLMRLIQANPALSKQIA